MATETSTNTRHPALVEAIGLVDVALERVSGRGQMTAAEVSDLLLDLRTSLLETGELAEALLRGVPELQD